MSHLGIVISKTMILGLLKFLLLLGKRAFLFGLKEVVCCLTFFLNNFLVTL